MAAITGGDIIACLQTLLAADCTPEEVQQALQDVLDATNECVISDGTLLDPDGCLIPEGCYAFPGPDGAYCPIPSLTAGAII